MINTKKRMLEVAVCYYAYQIFLIILKISNKFFCKKNPFSSVTDTRRQGKASDITEGWAQAPGPSLVQWRALPPWSSGITYKNRKKEIPT